MQYDLSFIWQSRKYFFNAWEYDWGSSKKTLGKAESVGQTLNFSGNRQFTDEWYIFDPQIVQDNTYAVPLTYLYNNIGSPAYPTPSNNPNGTTNDCASWSPFSTLSIKAELQFTRGWY